MTVTESPPTSRLDEFVRYARKKHAQDPAVWAAFERLALEFARRVPPEQWPTRRGARMLWEQIRWESFHAGQPVDGTRIKLNDHLIALYARAFMLVHPEYWGIFELRPMPSAKRPPRGRESVDRGISQVEFIYPDQEEAAAHAALRDIFGEGRRVPDPG